MIDRLQQHLSRCRRCLDLVLDLDGFTKPADPQSGTVADFEKAARALEEAAEGGDMAAIGAGTKALGKTCGGCHRTFRKPKEESYKRK